MGRVGGSGGCTARGWGRRRRRGRRRSKRRRGRRSSSGRRGRRRRTRRRVQGGGGAPAAALCVKAAGELPLLHHQLYESFNTDTEGKLMLFQLLLVLPPMCQSNLKVDPESNR